MVWNESINRIDTLNKYFNKVKFYRKVYTATFGNNYKKRLDCYVYYSYNDIKYNNKVLEKS